MCYNSKNYLCTKCLKLIGIFQNLGEIPNLNGIEEDESLREEMNVRALGFKALR